MLFGQPKPNKYDLKWKWMGIPIRVHFGFWIMAGLIGLLYGRVRPEHGLDNVVFFGAWFLAVFVTFLFHEMGHALVGRRFGSRNVHIGLFFMIGLAYGATGNTRKQRMLVSFAGPLADIIVGGIALFFLRRPGAENMGLYTSRFLQAFAFAGLGWGIFNLIPVYPLDGGHILGEFLSGRRPADGMALTHKISIVLAIVLATLGMVGGQLFTIFLFGYFAYINYKALQFERLRPW